MKRDDFRRLALALPEAIESQHQGSPDFRVANKIFASFGVRDPRFAVVKLSPPDQEMLCGAEPQIFAPIDGAWGRRGWTKVNLSKVDASAAQSALSAAWRTVAPRKLVAAHS